MDWKPLLALIDEGLKAKKLTDNSASNAAGHPDAIRNMRRKARGEQKGGVTFDTVFDIAKVLDISPLAICKAAMGHAAGADDYEILRQQALREAMAALQAQITPVPQPSRKRRVSSR